MKRSAFLLAVLLCCSVAASSDATKRPRILGIASVRIAAPPDAAAGFYTRQLGFNLEGEICGGACFARVGVDSRQRIELVNRDPIDPRTLEPRVSYLRQITFETSDIEALHLYFKSRGIPAGDIFSFDADGANPQFGLDDPEGHAIGFMQLKGRDIYRHTENQVSARLIHAGFVVRDRAAMDRFYKDILGFHVYWHGGMKEGEDNWVDMQVPDGTDWIEYMLNVSPNADHHTLGVMNHIALGVPDIKVAREQLIKNGWKPGEEPKIGRGGKWQLNVYDPDDTRIEFMEFTPTQKPCCSEYTGPHPGPKQ